MDDEDAYDPVPDEVVISEVEGPVGDPPTVRTDEQPPAGPSPAAGTLMRSAPPRSRGEIMIDLLRAPSDGPTGLERLRQRHRQHNNGES